MSEIWIYIAISEALSIYLLTRLWRGADIVSLKILASLVVLVPFLGPFMYLFASDETRPQPASLQNRGSRGQYTQRAISLRPIWKRTINAKQREHEDT
jgi:hypothetical protein